MRIRRFQSRFWAPKRRQKRYFTVDRFSPRPARDTIMPLSAWNTVLFRSDEFFSFAQWQYHNLWGSSEMWLLLIENYTQYPAIWTWNTVHIGNFWRKLRFPRNQKIPLNSFKKPTGVGAARNCRFSKFTEKLQKASTRNRCLLSHFRFLSDFKSENVLQKNFFCVNLQIFLKSLLFRTNFVINQPKDNDSIQKSDKKAINSDIKSLKIDSSYLFSRSVVAPKAHRPKVGLRSNSEKIKND